jgi:16S rRNA (guanine527-N7)-methyltransferase
LADIGSGAGVPGLILAELLPEVAVTLIDRRAGRAAWLEEAAEALAREGIGIRVRCGDVYDLARGEDRGRYDLVTARAFGSPVVTAELGGALLRTGGVLVVSEPPDQPDRWNVVDLEGLGLTDEGPAGAIPHAGAEATRRARFRVLVRRAPLASHRPRRTPRPA